MGQPRYPSLYQINTRVLLREISQNLGRAATLDDLGDDFLDRVADWGFNWLWPLGVWQTGPAGRAVSRSHPEWRREFESQLPDLNEEDISGSPFAVQEYRVHADFCGNEALALLRLRLRERGVRLLLDFVPNHTALDHRWAYEHPEYYIAGDESDFAREPHNYRRFETGRGTRILAHGRDPYFSGWPDTLQLNYRSRALRQAMIRQLQAIAGMCDGVRCDMAMLLLPEVIHRTWGSKSLPSDGTAPVDASFWSKATSEIRARHPDFTFMAEVYWDLEWALQQQGFDYTYDKRLYDRLLARDAPAVRGHLLANLEFQRKLVRFLENHDEPRAASAFPLDVHRAAAMITYLVPGLRFFHEGNFEGRSHRVSMHLGRRPVEAENVELRAFYGRLLDLLKSPSIRDGEWRLLECRPAWEGNSTWQNFLALWWESSDRQRLLITVNYGPTQGQCYVHLPMPALQDRQVALRDRMSTACYERAGNDLVSRGLYLDVSAWQFHAFDVLATAGP
ncbi:MAG: alpha-amylase [Planctomycetia bacterium]|nr:alpha-amylase [Planctomycetia bacterium]